MNLSKLQIEVLQDNLKPSAAIAEMLFQESIHSGKKHIPIKKWRAELERLSIRLDDISGVINSN
jgi:hypothetical protein